VFDSILLEPEQVDLLLLIVEASRATPRDNRHKFLVARTMGGDHLIHPGIPADKRSIYYGDVEILVSTGLLHMGFSSRGSPNFDVTPLGYRYYEYVKQSLGQAPERVEKTIRALLDSDSFRNAYPLAYSKWLSAEELLWRSDTQEHFTTVGHLCREAFQEFADALIAQHPLAEELTDKARTIGRVRAILTAVTTNSGPTHSTFITTLVNYWTAVNDLVQRQEHGATKEGQDLNWEDARRVVFSTLFAMYEVHKTVTS
jgi:hypothetical protein